MNEFDKPHYVYVCCVLYQGKIWKWNVSLHKRSLDTESMIFPRDFKWGDTEKYYEEFAELVFPIWVNNSIEHNMVFGDNGKSRDIYRMYEIHEDYCNGGKPY